MEFYNPEYYDITYQYIFSFSRDIDDSKICIDPKRIWYDVFQKHKQQLAEWWKIKITLTT